jgi:hypothetical protein
MLFRPALARRSTLDNGSASGIMGGDSLWFDEIRMGGG